LINSIPLYQEAEGKYIIDVLYDLLKSHFSQIRVVGLRRLESILSNINGRIIIKNFTIQTNNKDFWTLVDHLKASITNKRSFIRNLNLNMSL
jgi:hypothetical protein